MDRYDQALQSVRDRVAGLAEDVHHMLGQGLEAIAAQNQALAQAVTDHDDVIDQETADLEEEALQLLSLRQPRQDDLRILAATLRIVRDLERIADYACDIAEGVPLLTHVPDSLNDVIEMGQMALKMLHEAKTAAHAMDSQAAYRINRQDDRVDAYYLYIQRELLAVMQSQPDRIASASHLALIARYLERIADHAVNIAEMTVYMAEGIRQPFRRPPVPSPASHRP